LSSPPGAPPVHDAVGEATLELLDAFPGYTDFLWSRVAALVEMRGHVLEIGCGIGSITRRILRSPAVVGLDAFDIEPAYVDRVGREIRDARLKASCAGAEDFEPEPGAYDRVVSINVIEHVEDDRAALANIARALRPGGEAAVLVPAHPFLYSSLDRGLSHFRRYSRAALAARAREVGLDPVRIVHFNPLGAAGWWVNGKLLGRTMLPAGQVSAYARFGISLSRFLDRWNPFPVGISLIARMVKPADGLENPVQGGWK